MAQQPHKPKRADTTIKVRCRSEDREAFKIAAEREGFGGNVSAWMLYHLRRIAKVAQTDAPDTNR